MTVLAKIISRPADICLTCLECYAILVSLAGHFLCNEPCRTKYSAMLEPSAEVCRTCPACPAYFAGTVLILNFLINPPCPQCETFRREWTFSNNKVIIPFLLSDPNKLDWQWQKLMYNDSSPRCLPDSLKWSNMLQGKPNIPNVQPSSKALIDVGIRTK